MKDRSVERERYLSDPLPVRLGTLALNLARLEALTRDGRECEGALHALDESKWFIEWTAPEAAYDIQLEIVDLQVQLATWQYRWPEIWADPEQRAEVARAARRWSGQVLVASGLLDALAV